jgi:hypothetical protein
MVRTMSNGILRADEGFDVVVNGINRSFRDRENAAYEAARYLKERHPGDLIEVRVRATGQRVVILADGRAG